MKFGTDQRWYNKYFHRRIIVYRKMYMKSKQLSGCLYEMCLIIDRICDKIFHYRKYTRKYLAYR